jgi:hypothetical protein
MKANGQEDDQDQPDEAASPGKDIVAATVAVAAAQHGENQNHDKDQY